MVFQGGNDLYAVGVFAVYQHLINAFSHSVGFVLGHNYRPDSDINWSFASRVLGDERLQGAVKVEQRFLTLEVKFPFTEHIWRVGVWRSEQTFHSDAVIYNRCKAMKLIHMLVFTDILI